MTSVYLIASERSGTNLLRRKITESQNIYFGMSPAHLLKHLYYNEPYYGDLSNNENFTRFIKDALDLCYLHFAPWNIKLDTETILNSYESRARTSIIFCDFLMQLYAIEKGYEGYLCKDNCLYEFSLDIANKLENSKFIYLYRDPRDFVLSQLKRPESHKSIIRYSNMWAYEQTRSIRVAQELKTSNRCYSLSYEDFIGNPESHIEKICDFLDVDINYNERIKDTETIIEDVHEWKNLNSPIMANNRNKYLTGLSKKQVKIIECITCKQMKYLNYDTENKNDYNLTLCDKLYDLWISLSHRVAKKMKISNDKQPETVVQRSKLLKKFSINYFCRD